MKPASERKGKDAQKDWRSCEFDHFEFDAILTKAKPSKDGDAKSPVYRAASPRTAGPPKFSLKRGCLGPEITW
jgi:hypothetical protein